MGANLSEENDGPISAINVTPFVDVVLVLLVIFMVTAPMMMKDVLSINLPKASKADPKTLQTLGVAITAQGQVLLNGQLVSFEALSTEAKKAAANPDSQAIISADGEAKHADVVKVMDTLKSSGLNRLAIQVQRQ